jgi:magnesium-transporting ATPase (P-type)
LCVAKTQVIKLVNEYKVREFDEDICAIRHADIGGASGIIEKLKSHEKNGITPELNEQRKLAFGSNWKDPIVAESCCSMFKGALDDFMLKLLTICAIVSITVDMSMAEPHERSHAWIDGFAIMVAVLVVSGVGSIVDWNKEKTFVAKRNATEEEKKVKIIREGKLEEVHPNNCLVGDLIDLAYGD